MANDLSNKLKELLIDIYSALYFNGEISIEDEVEALMSKIEEYFPIETANFPNHDLY